MSSLSLSLSTYVSFSRVQSNSDADISLRVNIYILPEQRPCTPFAYPLRLHHAETSRQLQQRQRQRQPTSTRLHSTLGEYMNERKMTRGVHVRGTCKPIILPTHCMKPTLHSMQAFITREYIIFLFYFLSR